MSSDSPALSTQPLPPGTHTYFSCSLLPFLPFPCLPSSLLSSKLYFHLGFCTFQPCAGFSPLSVRFPLVHVCSPPIFLSRAGTEKRFELTPVAAVSVHLLASGGVELQVNRPITVSLPLPADSDLKENDAVPVWRFDPLLGMYRQKHPIKTSPLASKLFKKKT